MKTKDTRLSKRQALYV